MRAVLAALILMASCGVSATAQDNAPNQQNRPASVPWPARIGLRSLQVQQAFPVIDRVVLVPDGATYLDELGRWSLSGRWPVLFEDDRYAPMFIRAFEPKEVIRRTSVGDLPDSPDERRAMLNDVVITTFEGDPAAHTIPMRFHQIGHVPVGVVVTSVDDPAWTAAVALAAGHGQPIAHLDGEWGRPNADLDDENGKSLLNAVNALLDEQGYAWKSLGDQIETITICRDLASRANMLLPESAQLRLPTQQNNYQNGPIAVTDLLGRDELFKRGAFAGWIFGSETRSAYAAMCSLFLERSSTLFYNTYPNDAQWGAYGMGRGFETMKKSGFDATLFNGEQTTVHAWLRGLQRGFDSDLMLMNSKGGDDHFYLHDDRARPQDVPVLHRPLALHLIHSWSLHSPAKVNTVGGRWLDHGVYSYVGSAHEPLLGAFVPPNALIERWTSVVPFLVAARHWQEPWSRPWRITTIGDPLMLAILPPQVQVNRVDQPADRGSDLREEVKSALRRIDGDDPEQAFHDAAHMLNLLGEDDLAIQVWRMARQRGFADAAARPALKVLFRQGNASEFLLAWSDLPNPDHEARDMLWHLLTPRLRGGLDDDSLLLLESVLREPRPTIDFRRLAPQLLSRFGRQHVRSVMERIRARHADNFTQSEIDDLMTVY